MEARKALNTVQPVDKYTIVPWEAPLPSGHSDSGPDHIQHCVPLYIALLC